VTLDRVPRDRLVRHSVAALVLTIACTLGTVTTAWARTTASTTTAGSATTAPATPTPRWAPLPSFDTTLAWAPCHDGWECATLTVPVRWVRPTSTSAPAPTPAPTPADTVPLAVVRHRANAPDERIGSLVVNPGGPGQGGVDYLPLVSRRFPDEVLARFDIVSWDPRGTGASRPVDCVDDAFLDATSASPAVPDNAVTLAAARAQTATFAKGCTDLMGTYAGQVGTRNSARDLEAIRIALGEPTISYLGFSYGTVLGMTYAQMFPHAVRAMVLDGPPDYWLPSIDYSYAQAAGFRDAFDTFVSWCEQTPSCALRDLGAPREVFDMLRASLQAAPIAASYSADGGERLGTVTESTLATAALSSLYDERAWPDLARALARAAADGDGGPLLARADDYSGRSVDGTWSSLTEANVVISCVDRPEPKPRSAARELADVLRFQAALPPWGGSWATSACAGMPKPAVGDRLGDVRVRDTPPILVVGTTGDPATPYAGAVAMLSRISGATLLTREATEHTAFGTARSDCVDEVVTRYLTDLQLPAPDARC
jgi:pimeloyl-ACP methyl ester carboxylesterase